MSVNFYVVHEKFVKVERLETCVRPDAGLVRNDDSRIVRKCSCERRLP